MTGTTLPSVRYLTDTVRGFFMGAANIIPGVSGGTLALVLGIYERLVHNMRTGAGALASFLRGRRRRGCPGPVCRRAPG